MRRPRIVGIVLAVILAACADAPDPLSTEALDCRAARLVDGGRGLIVTGAEDLVVDPASGVVLVSAYNRQAGPDAPGRAEAAGLYALDAGAMTTEGTLAVRPLALAFKAERPLFPHGISLWSGADGGLLYAVNRIYESGEGAIQPVAIEVFDWDGSDLSYRDTLADPLLCRANDLIALESDSVLITADRGACDGFGILVENMFGLAGGHVLHWDGRSLRRVAEGLGFANGIAVRGDRTYVAATRDAAIHVFETAALIGPQIGGLAKPIARIDLPAGPDNLSWDQDGHLLAAAHPDLFGLFLYRERWFGTDSAPSRVLRIDTNAGQPIAQPYRSDGPPLSAATSAVEVDGRLIIAGGHTDTILICTAP